MRAPTSVLLELQVARASDPSSKHWYSVWIPWHDAFDAKLYVQNLRRELGNCGLVLDNKAVADLRARIVEAEVAAGVPPDQEAAAIGLLLTDPEAQFEDDDAAEERQLSVLFSPDRRSTQTSTEDVAVMAVAGPGKKRCKVCLQIIPCASKTCPCCGARLGVYVNASPDARAEAAADMKRVKVAPLSDHGVLATWHSSSDGSDAGASTTTSKRAGQGLSQGRKRCPKCENVIAAACKLCPHCGASSLLIGKGKKRCALCLAIVPASSRFCPECHM